MERENPALPFFRDLPATVPAGLAPCGAGGWTLLTRAIGFGAALGSALIAIAAGFTESAIWKKLIVLINCSAWLDSSSLVDAISSDAEAFCWMIFSSCCNAVLIWSAPVF